jgi:hypothetical protein
MFSEPHWIRIVFDRFHIFASVFIAIKKLFLKNNNDISRVSIGFKKFKKFTCNINPRKNN